MKSQQLEMKSSNVEPYWIEFRRASSCEAESFSRDDVYQSTPMTAMSNMIETIGIRGRTKSSTPRSDKDGRGKHHHDQTYDDHRFGQKSEEIIPYRGDYDVSVFFLPQGV